MKHYSRRQILSSAAVMAAGATLAPALTGARPARADGQAAPDVIVIGTGYAGSIAALRLAQAGIPALVLERGRRWPITPAGNTFGGPPSFDGRIAWLSATSPFTPAPLNVYTGVLEAFQAEGITALAGAGVGGGSLVNNAVMLQPSAALFQDAFGVSVPYPEMANYWYQRVRSLIGVAPIPDDVLASPYYTAARSFVTEATRAGLSPFRVDMAMDWQAVREEIAGTRVPSAIIARSIFGMNSGAKRSVDRTILAAAEETGLITLRTLTRVVDITRVNGRYTVTCEQIDETGTVLARPAYTARYVFLAAGSLGTSRLLVKARDTGRLPNLNSAVGTGWGTNGDRQTVRVGMPFNNPTQGGPSGIVVQDLSNSIEPVTMLNFPWPIPPADGTGAIGALAAAPSPAAGRFTYDPASGSVKLRWPVTDPAVTRTTLAVTETVNKLNAANPGTQTLRVNPDTTSHPLGGAVLGQACRSDGSLYGYDNLYVIDSSLIPGSVWSVPPALTVAALADRCVSMAVTRIKSAASLPTTVA